jgi:hypothetical protein
VLALATAAAAALVLTELLTVVGVDVGGGPACEDLADPDRRSLCAKSGGEQHGYALVLLGLLAFALGAAADRAGSRPAAFALGVLGLVVILVALIVDLPDTRGEGAIGPTFTLARSTVGPGFYLELLGAALALAASAVAVKQTAPSKRPGRTGPGG